MSASRTFGVGEGRACPTRRVQCVGGWVLPKDLKRQHGRGYLHSLTFSCYRLLPVFNTMLARNVTPAPKANVCGTQLISSLGARTTSNGSQLRSCLNRSDFASKSLCSACK